MKGDSQKLIKFFEGSDKRFCIPLYQRNYDWKEDNCRQLFEDLKRVHRTGGKSHFFGSIVSCVADYDEEVRLIIDGQQRITTVSLILIAMINAAKAGDLAYDKKDRINFIKNAYLIDEYQENERKVKLKPIKNDMDAFDALIYKEPDEYINDSNVTKNYRFFYDKIKNCGLKLEELLDAIKKLEIINVRLEHDDDPQLIFESLNSTGLGLSESDKIRNYLLMSLSATAQERSYNSYWNKIEEATDYQPTMFIRDYLTVKTRKIAKLENLYFDFKQYSESSKLTREDIMADMLIYAHQYNKVIKASVSDAKLQRKLTQLSYIGSSVHMPFCMSFLIYADLNKLSTDEIYEVFNTLECYWARRIICNLPANALSKVFSTLHTDILKLINEFQKRGKIFNSTYHEVMKYTLLRKQGSSELPTDTKVEEEMKTRNVYKMPNTYRQFIFERMNNGLSKEFIDIVGGMKDGTISIEHIMPQTLSAKWKAELGPHHEELYDRYIHTFANLTLSAYNQSYSNAPFKTKKDGMIDKDGNKVIGFKDSIYSLSADLKEYTKWTEAEILDRQAKLISRFKSIWPMIQTCFTPMEKPTDSVTFNDEDIELTGRDIAAFTYNGEKHMVTSWKSMLLELCGLIYDEHKNAIDYLCSKNSWFHTEEQKGRTCFAPRCYVSSDNSTQTKLTILNVLFKECSIPDEALTFELHPMQNSTDNE